MKGVESLDQMIARGVSGRRIFVRSDLNVPIQAGVIRDESRVHASLPTIEKLARAGARVVVASHLGRPKGRRQADLSLEPVAKRMQELLGRTVTFASTSIGAAAEASVAALQDGEILLLENLRFESGETQNERDHAEALARLADAYVFDAFGSAHRAHASTVGIQEFLVERATGELVERELARLEALREPPKPFVCLLGGAKVTSKTNLLESLLLRADVVALAGEMAYSFLDATGHCVGQSVVYPEIRTTIDYVLSALDRTGCKLLLPSDHLVVRDLESDETPHRTQEIRPEEIGVDIGPETAARYAAAIEGAASVFWNGPLGIFELPGCGDATEKIAHAVACCPGYAVVGGGETVEALRSFGVEDGPDHVSTGGSAALAFVAGEDLPALRALVGS